MDYSLENLEKLSADRCCDLKFGKTMDVVQVFNSREAIDSKNLYIARFGRLPNWINMDVSDCKKISDWLVQNYHDAIVDCSYSKHYNKSKGLFLENIYYFMFDDLLVLLNEENSTAKLLFRKTDTALINNVMNEIITLQKDCSRKSKINLLVKHPHGFGTREMTISAPDLSIEDNYNDNFLPMHHTILERLGNENDKGLILFHGKPGTGKTSYIRYLISNSHKPVIFLPPNMAAYITDPGLMHVLISNPNSIFVIEDAENIIIDRNRNGSSSVSALLNLADGLLSDCLNIQIVCSFNTDLSRVDSALTRKGRLIAKYEFTELSVPKAQALSNKLGFSSVISTPMTLAEIYNQSDAEYDATTQRKTIGFKIAV